MLPGRIGRDKVQDMGTKQTPLYRHDGCSCCKYLGTSVNKGLDYYICDGENRISGGTLSRTFIARCGSSPADYASHPLFCGVELTNIDKIALYHGLDLTETEEK